MVCVCVCVNYALYGSLCIVCMFVCVCVCVCVCELDRIGLYSSVMVYAKLSKQERTGL